MLDSLVENFRMKLEDFHSQETNIFIFENLLSAEVNDAPGKLQL
jgi:hypothetical protein